MSNSLSLDPSTWEDSRLFEKRESRNQGLGIELQSDSRSRKRIAPVRYWMQAILLAALGAQPRSSNVSTNRCDPDCPPTCMSS